MAETRASDSSDGQEHVVTAAERSKWDQMLSAQGGISEYMRQHPDRFHRRVRRGIPPEYRWDVWKAAVRLESVPMPSNYEALATTTNSWTPQIEIDICRTFPESREFGKSKQDHLMRVLNAYAGHRPEVGYCQGMNFVAGLLILVSDNEKESFRVLVSLMENVGLNGFYREKLPLLRKYLKACDQLVKESVPELREHFIKENVQPAVYLHQWFLTLFINCFPLSMVYVIWDVIVCEGLPVVLRIAVSILQVLKDSLLAMHFEDIIKFFKMMKTYDDEDGELNAFRIGQLLMKHTEHVQIPEKILEYINRDITDDDAAGSDEEFWEGDLNNGSMWQTMTRMFSAFGTTRRTGQGETGSTASSSTGAAPTGMRGGMAAGGQATASSGDAGREPVQDESLTRAGWEFL